MASQKKVALVTGSNKGIGFAIVKILCERLQATEWDVYLTSRDVVRGEAAVEKLNQLGLKPAFHQLDISDANSRKALIDDLKSKYQANQCLNILVNNAAIAFKMDCTLPQSQQAVETIAINFTATKALCDEIFPLLRPHARVVNVSSSAGMLSKIPDPKIREQLASDAMTVDQLLKLVDQYLADAKEEKMQERGWGGSCYAVSKVFLTKLTMIQQKAFDQDRPGDDIIVNACHPGYVATDMSSHKGPMTIEEGAQTPVKLSLLPPSDPSNPKGQMFWYDGKLVNWTE